MRIEIVFDINNFSNTTNKNDKCRLLDLFLWQDYRSSTSNSEEWFQSFKRCADWAFSRVQGSVGVQHFALGTISDKKQKFWNRKLFGNKNHLICSVLFLWKPGKKSQTRDHHNLVSAEIALLCVTKFLEHFPQLNPKNYTLFDGDSIWTITKINFCNFLKLKTSS